MFGVVKKYTNMVSGYKVRNLELKGGVLTYYKDKNESKNLGQISLQVAKIDEKAGDDKTLVINTGTKTIKFKFKDQAEKVEWMYAIT